MRHRKELLQAAYGNKRRGHEQTAERDLHDEKDVSRVKRMLFESCAASCLERLVGVGLPHLPRGYHAKDESSQQSQQGRKQIHRDIRLDQELHGNLQVCGTPMRQGPQQRGRYHRGYGSAEQ